jgi:hypothetical protein
MPLSPSWLDDFKDVGPNPEVGDSLNCAQVVTAAKLGLWQPNDCSDLLVEGARTKCCGPAVMSEAKGKSLLLRKPSRYDTSHMLS